MSSFAALNEVDKIERRKAKEQKRMAAQQAKLARDAEFGTESVKNLSWAEIDSDEEPAPAPVSDTESDEESRAPSSPARSPLRSPKHPPLENGKLMLKAEKDVVKPLSKKEKAAQKQKELDNLDDVLAEFGLDVPAPPSNDSKKRKKKGRDKAGEAMSPRELSPEAAPVVPEEVEQELDEDTKLAALDALRKKAAGKKNKGGKSAAATAAAEAKKRAANNKPKRDRMQYDR